MNHKVDQFFRYDHPCGIRRPNHHPGLARVEKVLRRIRSIAVPSASSKGSRGCQTKLRNQSTRKRLENETSWRQTARSTLVAVLAVECNTTDRSLATPPGPTALSDNRPPHRAKSNLPMTFRRVS